MVTPLPRLSIVVEWANTDWAGVARSATMLGEVARQARALAAKGPLGPLAVELLVVQSHGTTTAPAVVDAFLGAQTAAGNEAFIDCHVMTAPDTGYYGLKNYGASRARGEIIVFVDSDVVPEDGWLAALLAPMADSAVEVVAGHAYIASGGPYHKAFALCWFFPLRLEHEPRASAPPLFANNVAMRRETAVRYPFATEGATSRGACLELIRQLTAAGIVIHGARDARVAHPPPNGLAHFVARGLAQGRDRFLRAQAGAPGEEAVAASFTRAARHIGRSLARIATRRHEVHLSLLEVPLAAGVAVSYYTLYLAGELLTRLRPGMMVQRFRI